MPPLRGYISQAYYGRKSKITSHLVRKRRKRMEAIIAFLVVSVAHSLALPAVCPLISDSFSFTSALANLTLPGNITSVVNTTTLRCSKRHHISSETSLTKPSALIPQPLVSTRLEKSELRSVSSAVSSHPAAKQM